MIGKEDPGARFWRHALSIYGQEAARDACLRLQDRDGCDVPMLLLCLWCVDEGRTIPPPVMREAVDFSRDWRKALVEPVRALRRGWKGGIAGLPSDPVEAARQQVGAAEQGIEKLQMMRLAAMVTRDEPGGGAVRVADPFEDYLRAAGLYADPSDLSALADAARKVCP